MGDFRSEALGIGFCRAFSIPNLPRRMLFGLGAVLQHSHTPSLRVTGFEDDDEDENEAPCERLSLLCWTYLGLDDSALG
jgi:hypothetical protein